MSKPEYGIGIFSLLLLFLFVYTVSGVPSGSVVASYSATPVQGPSPLCVSFTDLSTGPVRSWSWDFDDGEISLEQNPVHIYTDPGYYSVSLTVSSLSNTDTQTKIGFIRVFPPVEPPKTDFSAAPVSGSPPLQVSFQDLSGDYPGSRLWIFGDGTTSEAANPVHSYIKPGIYSVSLVVKGDFGEEKVEKTRLITVYENTDIPLIERTQKEMENPVAILTPLQDITSGLATTEPKNLISDIMPVPVPSKNGSLPVPIAAPDAAEEDEFYVARLSAEPTLGTVPLTVSFKDISEGPVTMRSWSFGDGVGSQAANPIHQYKTPGVYDVQLLIKGESGGDQITKTGLIRVADMLFPLKASFSTDTDNGPSPLTVTFTDTSDGDIDRRAWSFGDGTTSLEQNPVHTFSAAGTYDVRLTVSGPGGEFISNAAITVTAPPEGPFASFTTDTDNGPSPLTVTFTDTSDGDIDRRAWSFGDGTTSLEQNPVHTFTAAGTYDVRLTVSGPGGESISNAAITVTAPPFSAIASFSTDTDNGFAPLTVTFTDTSDGDIDRRAWSFGDGTTSDEQNPVHTYSNAGTYDVRLTVSGPGGESISNAAITVTAPPEGPIASFTTDTDNGTAPLTVTFTDTSSGEIDRRAWSFGDGTTSDEQNPVHTYSNAGTYDVRLTVSGPGGESILNTSITATAPPEGPIASFTTDTDNGTAPLTVTFTDTSSGEIDGWDWSFGDGTTSLEQNPVHTFTAAGTYDVCLTVSGPGGESISNASITVTAPPEGPIASFSTDTDNGSAPLTVTFTDTSDGDIDSRVWFFGDGTTSLEQNPVHTFTVAGTYDIRLTVTGPGGESISNTLITVTAPPISAIASFSTDTDNGFAPLTVTFTDTSDGDIDLRAWSLGDGATSDEQNPVHTYSNAGTYDVRLTVSGPGGESISNTSITVTAPPEGPIASFTTDTDNGPSPLTVTFTDTSDGDIDRRAWSLGDGATSDEQNPVHTYTNAGTYDVRLTVSGPGGESISNAAITVTAPPEGPIASFTTDTDNGLSPLTVTFTDTSDGDIDSRAWSFGDGTHSHEQNPVHTYTNAGTYDVRLTITGPGGESISNTLITVTAPPEGPIASFSPDTDNGFAPLTVTFTDTSDGDVDGWDWSLGDGTTSLEQNPVHTYSNAGTYDVRLTVSGPGGESISNTLITVTASPVVPGASFSTDTDNGFAPLTVTFTDTSDGDIDGRVWSLGDGATSDEQNPVHTYSNAGTYDVRLIVSGPGGESVSNTSITVTPAPAAPLAYFTTDIDNGTAPLTVTFTDISDGDINTREWSFGDGTSSVDRNPVHTYEAAGSYHVLLRVKGAGGEEMSSGTIMVTSPPSVPKAGFRFDADAAAPLTVSFTDTSEGDLNTCEWFFGDGTSSVDRNPVHSYTTAGIYDVELQVTGPGGTDRIKNTVTVLAASPAPVAGFHTDADGGTVPLMVSFTDTSSGEITAREWFFGDGGISREIDPVHTFTTPGPYLVVLQVIGPGGMTDARKLIRVTQDIPELNTSFIASPKEGYAPLKVAYTDQSDGRIDAWQWNFGDGYSSSEQNPVHTFLSPGVYPVWLMVERDGVSSKTHEEVTVFISPVPPKASCELNPGEGLSPLTVSFTDTSTGDIGNRTWSFGDGEISSLQNPVHLYQNPGTYRITLEVTGPGGTDTASGEVMVSAPVVPPKASCEINPGDGLAPLTVSFTDTSTGDIGNRTWSFGDGEISFLQNPVHLYQNPGTYRITLEVTGPGGTDTASGEVMVSAPVVPPNASSELNPGDGLAPLTVSFTDTSTGDIGNRTWSFGDGEISSLQNPVHLYQNPGTYRITLEVTGPGGTDTASGEVMVSAPVVPPKASFITDRSFGEAPLMVAFADMSDGTIRSWNWSFGDGAVSSLQNPVHMYQNPGTYTITLEVTGSGGSDTVSGEVMVSAPVVPLKASFITDHSFGEAPLMVAFADMSDGTIRSWNWSFGDGEISSLQNPVHSYQTPGIFTVNLTVDDGSGSDAATGIITVKEVMQKETSSPLPIPGSLSEISGKSEDRRDTGDQSALETKTEPPSQTPVQASFTADRRSGYVPLPVVFTDTSQGDVRQWHWDFGDGDDAYHQHPGHTYKDPGIYDVTLVVSGNYSYSSRKHEGYIVVSQQQGQDEPEMFQPLLVQEQNPETYPEEDVPGDIRASFTQNRSLGKVPFTVIFTDTSTGSVECRYWFFGDDSSSSERNPMHTYLKKGTYYVTLSLCDDGSVTTKTANSVVYAV